MKPREQTVEGTPARVFSGWLTSFSSFSTFRALLLISAVLMALFFLAQAVRFLPVTSDNVYPESAGVLASQRWAHGEPLYADYRQPPYLMTPFTPLWYGLLALVAKLGLVELDTLALFGRLLSLASLCGIAALGYLWNRRLGLSSSLAVLTPALYLGFPILIPWAVTARPDLPALFLAFLALYVLGLQPTTASVALAGVVAALAFLMRHNAVAVPVVIVLWLVWSRKWNYALVFSAMWALVAGSALLFFYLSSHGLLLLNLSGAKFGQFALTYIHDVLTRLLAREGHGLAVALLAFGAFGFLQSLKQGDLRIRLISIYLLVSLGFAVVGSAAAGAAVNYYLEPALAMAVLVPIGLARLEAEWNMRSPLALFAVVITLALILPSLDIQRWNGMHSRPENLRPLIPLVKNGLVFTDEPYLAARMSMPQAIDLASLINTQRTSGWAAWSSAQIAKDLQEQKYELVILRTPTRQPYFPYNPASPYPRWPRLDSAIQTAIARNYGLCFERDSGENYGRVYVYGRLSMDMNSSVTSCP